MNEVISTFLISFFTQLHLPSLNVSSVEQNALNPCVSNFGLVSRVEIITNMETPHLCFRCETRRIQISCKDSSLISQDFTYWKNGIVKFASHKAPPFHQELPKQHVDIKEMLPKQHSGITKTNTVYQRSQPVYSVIQKTICKAGIRFRGDGDKEDLHLM